MPYMAKRGRFVTIENFILDTFTRIDEHGTEVPIERPDEIGGAGTYTIVGARIFLPADRLGMMIDYTPTTLPRHIRERLTGYGRDTFFFRQRHDGHPTLRAVNRYQGQLRIFEYLTEPCFYTPRSFTGTPLAEPLPGVLHFVPMEARLVNILKEVDEMSKETPDWQPILIWEPDIPICRPEYYELIRSQTPRTDIISPNHTEALALLSLPPASTSDTGAFKRSLSQACVLIGEMRPKKAAVIRCGSMGCCYFDTSRPGIRSQEDVIWVPPYWEAGSSDSEDKVVDPTGAGNAFMGGLGAALDAGQDLHTGILWGTVAASFVIEQNGLPSLTSKNGKDWWNGEDPMVRVERLRQRLAK